MPELRHLRVFVAVAEQLSFTRAAERLHLTQQSVSRTVGELERELGVTLLERTTREVRLTPAGVSLLRDGAEAVRAADAAFVARARDRDRRARARAGRGLARDRAGRPRRGRPRAAPARVRRLGRAARGAPADLRPMLRSHELDVALTRVSGVDDDTLHSARLRPTPMVLCVPAGAPAGGARRGHAARAGRRAPAGGEPARDAYTDLLVGAIEAAGARVEPVEARVTGGAALLTELAEQRRRRADAGRDAAARRDRDRAGRGLRRAARAAVAGGRPSAAVERLGLAL